MRKSIFLSAIMLFFAGQPLWAAVRLVPSEYNTIQGAINDCNNGDMVIVSPGTYYENINFLGKNITISGTEPDDWNIIKATIIDGNKTGSVVTFNNGETNEAVLEGFTIRGGYGSINLDFDSNLLWGAGIYCYNSSPFISNNIITGNYSLADIENDLASYGGGISCLNSSAIITNNIIKNNLAAAGGGIMSYSSTVIITNNVISNNSAAIGGGVVLLGGTLINNTITDNDADVAGGGMAGNVYASFQEGNYDCRVINNIICNAKSGGGVYYLIYNGISYVTSTELFRYNNVWNNQPQNYYNMYDDSSAEMTGFYGNISQNPLFINEYHIGKDSPCYDAGDPNYGPYLWQRDIDGEFPVMDSSVDIGADEVTGNARPVADAGDVQHFYTYVSNVNLDGTGSYDPDNSGTLTYHWKQISGPNAVLSDSDIAEPNFTPPVEAVYEFELTVSDDVYNSQPDIVMIIVGNQIPVANAGIDQSCQIRKQVFLNGSGSYDSDVTDILSYSWVQVSGPLVELSDANTAFPSFTPSVEGNYVFLLVVSDGVASSQPDTVSVICTVGSMPDAYGYSWIDSDSPWGPAYHWIDIQGTGNMVSGVENSLEESFGPFSLGFNFNFYGNTYNSFYVQSEGLISFGPDPITYSNYPIPNSDGYNNIIAWMWTLHYPQSGSKIYYQSFGDYCVIQFVNYYIYWNDSTVNAEVILYKSGKIVIQYKDFSNLYPYCTIGIENIDGTIGSQVAYEDYNYLHDKLAIEFTLGGPYEPVAKAGDEQQYKEIELITLDGTGSFDRDPNDILTYQWTQTGGPSVVLSDPTSAQPTFMPPEKGIYQFELVVSDGTYTSYPDEVMIVIGNRVPFADAGEEQYCKLGDMVYLNGSGSYDLDDVDVLSYRWTQISGPAAVLSNPDIMSPSFTPTALGEYVFQLVVSDGEVFSQPDTVKITCKIGSAPDAYGYSWIDSDNNFGPAYYWEDISNSRSYYDKIAGSSGRLLGSITLSFDFNFYGKKYRKIYIQSSGVISFGSDTIYSYNSIPSSDSYNNMIAWMWSNMELTTNSKVYYKGYSDRMVVQFFDWTLSSTYGTVNAQVILYKSGKIVILYKDASLSKNFGSYSIGIENSDGTIGTQVAYYNNGYLHDELAIEFSTGGPYEPVARAGTDQQHKVVELITLDGSGSNDRDPNYVLTYQWTQKSGPSVTLSSPTSAITTFTPPSEGEYIFQLIVNDGTYSSYPDEVKVFIGNQKPIADAGDNKAVKPGVQASLNGSASYDPDVTDTIVSYSWTQVSGPTVTLSNPNFKNPSFTPSIIGEYVFQLVVSDGVDISQPDLVTVFCTYGSVPDNYGYSWVDSDSIGGPVYKWIDIQNTGILVPGTLNSYQAAFGPYSLGFNFNFYGNVYNKFYIQASGAITFDSAPLTYNNKTIPIPDTSNNMIAWFWMMHYLDEDSKIYYQQFGDYTVVQFVDYEIDYGGSVNAEVILYKSGKIVIQFNEFSSDAYKYQHTIGIENADGTDGLQVSYNSSYPHDELAIEFSFGPPYEPFAEAGSNQYIRTLELVTLDGSASFDRDPGETLAYQWTQIDGPSVILSNPAAMKPTFLPQAEGAYKFHLTVSNSGQTSKPDYVTVFVGNEAPIADAGSDKVVNIPCTVTLDGSFSHDYDLNDVLTYIWSQTEGPAVVLENSNTVNPSFYCDQEGVYQFIVIVNDGLDIGGPDTVTVKTASTKTSQQVIDLGYEISDYFYYPSLCGDKLVYCYGSESDYSWDIYYDNLTTGILYSFAAGGIDTHPRIDGDIVVWFGGMNLNEPWGNEPRNSSVIARNLVTGVQKTLKGFSMSSSYSHPAISGKKVVWVEHHNLDTLPIGSSNAENWWNTTYSICGADVGNLNNPAYFTIAPNVGTRDPYPVQNFTSDFDDVIDIDGNIVVYEANGDIYGADISDLDNIKVFTICSNPSRQYDPAISGNIVVWTDQRNDLGDICGADISDMNNIRSFSLVKAAGIQQQPAIDGRYMVYVDGDTDSGNIKAAFIAGQCAMDIPLTGAPYGSGPVIDGKTILWQTATHQQLEALSIEFLYSTVDGPVQNTTSGKKYDYIQHAIDDSNDGDTIIVEPGLYCENIDTHGKNLKISSTDPNDPAIVESTVLSAMNNDYAAVTYSDGQDVNSVLEGFTITGSKIGIYCEEFSSPTISKCVISGNSQYGIYLYRGCEPLISECVITNNGNSGVKMKSPNEAVMYYNMPVITNCIISGNGMFGVSEGQPTILNCTIADNTLCGLYNSVAIVSNSIIYFNGDGSLIGQVMGVGSTITYSDVQGTWPGAGNIDSDPMFADNLSGDYHLKSAAGRWDPVSLSWVQDSSSSPCIDAGDPANDAGLEPAPNGLVINIGAYGGTEQASKS